jgi:hypothetical protein
MSKQDEVAALRAKVAVLESKIDVLETEFVYLNKILVDCGFANGIDTLKLTVEEVLSEGLNLPQTNRKEEEDLF